MNKTNALLGLVLIASLIGWVFPRAVEIPSSVVGGTTRAATTIDNTFTVTGLTTLASLTLSGSVTGATTTVERLTHGGATLATSTAGGNFLSALTTDTITAAQVSAKYVVVYTPNTASTTLIFQATSSWTALIPNEGDTIELEVVNGTTSVVTNLIIAEGTGFDMESASTSANVVAGGTALIRFTRKANTDIRMLVSLFADES